MWEPGSAESSPRRPIALVGHANYPLFDGSESTPPMVMGRARLRQRCHSYTTRGRLRQVELATMRSVSKAQHRRSTLARVDEDARSRPTMREVAALAGVSLKSVSRVINAEPAVSPELASRVHAAIERLDYRHNRAASSLRRSDGRSAAIGVLLEDVANPFS